MICKNINGIGKIPAVLCMLCMLLVSLPVNAKGNTKLTTSVVTAERGDTAAVTFTLEGNPGIWGLKMKVDYDHSALTLQSVTNGSIFEESEVVLPESLSREQFVFLAASNKLEDITADGAMVTLNFLVEKDTEAKSYPVTLEVTQAINCAGEDVKISAESGSVTVNVVSKPDVSPVSEESEPENAGTELAAAGAKTGDNSNPVIWIAVIMIALAGIGACCALHIRRGHKGL